MRPRKGYNPADKRRSGTLGAKASPWSRMPACTTRKAIVVSAETFRAWSDAIFEVRTSGAPGEYIKLFDASQWFLHEAPKLLRYEPIAWYSEGINPETGIFYRSVTFNAGDATTRHKPLYGAAPLLQWRPIADAPTDGTHCIVAYECPAAGWTVRNAWYRDAAAIKEMQDCASDADESDIGWWWYRNSCTQEMIHPTHFLCETPESPK